MYDKLPEMKPLTKHKQIVPNVRYNHQVKYLIGLYLSSYSMSTRQININNNQYTKL